MLKKLRIIKQIVTQNQAKYNFGQGKFEKIIKKDNKKYEKNQLYEESILQSKKEYTTNPKTFVPLSDALNTEKKQKFIKQFVQDKEKVRKNLKKNYQKNIDQGKKDVYEYAQQQNEFLSSQLFSTELNKHYIDEVNAFKKLYFEKQETKRLIEEERLKKSNVLDQSKDNLLKGYDKNIELLNNIRIQDMMSYSKENKNLGLLIQSGLLNKEKNLQQVIKQANELKNEQIQNQINNDSQQYLNNNSPINNNYQLEFEQQQEKQEKQLQQNKEIIIDSKTNNNQIQKIDEKKDEKQMAEMISNMGLKLKQDELKFVDFSVLKEFFTNYIDTTPQEKIKTIGKLKLMQQIKDYEKYIFETQRNNHITLRVKGRIQYKDMTEQESLNYIKYNLQNTNQIFEMFSQIKDIQQPEITAQMVQKMGSFKFAGKENLLQLIQHKSYKAIQRKFIDHAEQLDHEHFIGSVFSFGKLHEHELGIVSPKLYKKLNEVCKQQILERSEYLTFEELSFLTRGIVRLDMGKDQEIINNLVNNIEQFFEAEQGFHEQNIYALQGIINFLQFSNHNQAPKLLYNIINYLTENKEIFEQEFDHYALGDVIGGIFTLLIKFPKKQLLKKTITQLIINYQQQILQNLPEIYATDMKNLLILLNHIEYGNYKILREIKRETIERIKKTDHLFKQQDISQLVSGFAQQDLIRKNKKYLLNKNDNHYNFHTLSEVNHLGQFFPKLVFPNSSPNYIIYSKLAKIANESIFLFNPKNLSLLVYGLSSVEYKNFQFYDNVVQYILSQNEDDQDMKPKTENIELLGMLLQHYSITNRIEKNLFELLEYMKNIYMSMSFTKSTPVAWINYINTISNLRLLEGQADILEEKELIKVIYYDKIHNYLMSYTLNINLSLLYSMLSLQIYDLDIISNLVDIVEDKLEDYNNKLTPYQAVILLQIKNQLKLMDKQIDIQFQQNNKVNNIQENEDLFGDENGNDIFDMEINENLSQNNQKLDLLNSLNSIEEQQLLVLYDEYETDLVQIIESKSYNNRFTYTQIIDQIHDNLPSDIEFTYNQPITKNNINNLEYDINLPVQFYLKNSNTLLFIYTTEHFIYPFSEIQEDNTLRQIFAEKENILNKNGINIKRIYTSEFQTLTNDNDRKQFLLETLQN